MTQMTASPILHLIRRVAFAETAPRVLGTKDCRPFFPPTPLLALPLDNSVRLSYPHPQTKCLKAEATMARIPQDITDAELAVLQVLWDEGPCSIRFGSHLPQRPQGWFVQKTPGPFFPQG